MKNTSTSSNSSSAAAPQAVDAAALEGLSPEDLVTIIEKKSEVIDAQQKRIAILEEYLRLERARRFGPSSEKHPNQGELALNAEGSEKKHAANDAAAHQALDELNDMNDTAPAKKRGRKGLSKNLPRHQVRIPLSDEEKAGAIDTFYTVVKEELDIQRAKARVIEYLQEKAVFVDNNVDKSIASERKVVSAPLPKHPLNKCIASVGLLSYIIVAKFCDGLSLYHLEKIIKRYGSDITRTSLSNWTIRLGDTLKPLVTLAQTHQCAHNYIQMDETRLKVLKESNTSPQSEKWMWVMKGGPPDKPSVVFHYDPSRSAEVPARLLEGFQGYLQCDGLSSYGVVSKNNNLTHLGCWDHARRKFKDAVKAQPKKKAEPERLTLAEEGLGKIAALYRLERHIKDASADEKYQKRQKIALPLLNALKQWLNANIAQTAKGGLTYKALYYTLNQWEKLVRYCDNGWLHISNAGAENAIRPLAVGRRRWLFCDTPQGAKATAIHYSLIESAKANGICPEEYYNYILPRVPYADTTEKWEALLPWNVKRELEKNTPEK